MGSPSSLSAWFRITLTALALIVCCVASGARAAAFDPSAIVSDAFFTAKNSMTVADIQAFLVQKGSVLASLPPDQLGEGASGRSAAQIIYDAATVNRTDFASSLGYGPSNPLVLNLNPQVLLITLQKEQSLVTATYVPGSPTTTTALRSAMGYGCPDSGGCDAAYAGFANQVTYAGAQLMMNYYKGTVLEYKPGQTYTFTNTVGPPYNAQPTQQVAVGNLATSSLYRYTPHVYNGNYNFWYYANLWFSAPVLTGEVAKDPLGATIYFIKDSVRYPIDSMETLAALNLSDAAVPPLTVDQQAMPVGPLVRRLIQDGKGSVSLLIRGAKHPIASAAVFEGRGFQWEAVSPPNPLADALPFGLPYHELAKMPDTPAVYLMSNSRGFVFKDPETFLQDWGFAWADIAETPAYTFSPFPLTGTMTRLAKGSGPAVYAMDGGKRLAIDSADTFAAWKFAWGDVNALDDDLVGRLPAGPKLGRLVKGSGPAVFLVENGTRRPFLSARSFTSRGYQWGQVVQVSDRLLGTLSTGAPLN